MADSLGNQNGRRFRVRHDREVASLRHWEKGKVVAGKSEKRCEDASHSKALHAKSMGSSFVFTALWECVRVPASLWFDANINKIDGIPASVAVPI
jgi:hypothetical protein